MQRLCARPEGGGSGRHTADGVGFLVLVPQITLIKTWTEEIAKHTRNFSVLVQQANGLLLSSASTIPSRTLFPYTIVISTLGRVRDHPLDSVQTACWKLVIIDECLAVQCREALQTQEAWRQVMCSHYGVVMLSATFFR
jgi:hypothetical protein